ncbi:MAG: leucine-rich repeat domain-containing protein [Clostridia bacterium]|nr:leucine-rich repeat domain-containing protein [Clostridia bacterium]
MKTINIGPNVKVVPNWIFAFLRSVTDVTMVRGVETIGTGAFYGCSSLTNLSLANSITSIGVSAFRECTALDNVELPMSLISIGDFSFYQDTGLTAITIPENVKKLGMFCFAYCTNLDLVTYNATDASETDVIDPADGLAAPPFSNSGNNLVIGSNVKALPDECFRTMKCTSVTLPIGLERIGAEVFTNLKFTSIEIPASVKSIGEDAFKNCTSLEEIRIRNSEENLTGAPWGAPASVNIVWDP